MSEDAGSGDGVDEVTSAMLTASRLLVAISARSLAAVEDAVTPAQFRLLVVLASQGPAKLVTLAGLLEVNPSTALRMVDRLAAAGLVDRR
ncbi:MarR family transcriptional regulator, partial [Flavihumibacter sediminis]|nr:MarR family transcriptional regulator [Flavihumibacter sediminis]